MGSRSGGGRGSGRTSGGGGSPNSLDRGLLKTVSGHSTNRADREAEALARSMPATSRWRMDYGQAVTAGATASNAKRYADARHTGRVAVLRGQKRDG